MLSTSKYKLPDGEKSWTKCTREGWTNPVWNKISNFEHPRL